MKVTSTSYFSTIIASFVYHRYLNSGRFWSHAWYALRQIILKIADPSCIMKVHGHSLRMPLSLNLPATIKHEPYYDTLPRRLSEFIRKKHGRVVVVDVGANVGDSIIAFQGDQSLAIEANPRICDYLLQNVDSNVKVVECLCSNYDGEGVFMIEEAHSSAAFHPGEGVKMPVRTVDTLVKEHEFDCVNILKIDTDGYDLEVLDGAQSVLSGAPAVLFECYAPSIAYIPSCLATLRNLQPYKSLLLYSKNGYLMGRHSLSNLSAFEDLLYYALASGTYFDILLLEETDMEEFYVSEKKVFSPN